MGFVTITCGATCFSDLSPNLHTQSDFIDCKTVGFFLKISKEIGKAWRTSLTQSSDFTDLSSQRVAPQSKN